MKAIDVVEDEGGRFPQKKKRKKRLAGEVPQG